MPGSSASGSMKKNGRQVDIPGMFSFALTATSFLVLSDFVAKGQGLQSPLAIAFAVSFGIFGVIFLLIQGYWAPRPLIPLPLLASQSVGPFLAVQILMLCAQFTVRSTYDFRVLLLMQGSSSQTLPPTLLGLKMLRIQWRLSIFHRPL